MPTNYQAIAKETLLIEADALRKKAETLGNELDKAIEIILACKGKLIITGVGKSGLIGAKMAATFASTGTPSFFLHPTEALHGDLGMIGSDDVILAISYSGESEELSSILPHVKRFDVPLIGMTRNASSSLGKFSDVVIDITIEKEACPLGIAPTTSTTLTLAMGDALAVALMKVRDFKKEDFASFHPGGSLGRQLFVKIADLMQKELPTVTKKTPIQDAIITMSSGRLGTVFIEDDQGDFVGVVSDGDIRRALLKPDFDIKAAIISIANTNPKSVDNDQMLAADALAIIEKHKIQMLAVVNNGKLLGAIHLHTLVQAGIAS
jgi:arabinose-5-phosphate isomerase